MTPGRGLLELTAAHSGGRTVLERVRYEGISRCSRAFSHSGATLVVVSQLGPGVVGGDGVTTTGRLRPGSHLIVTSQTATRVLGGRGPSGATARWVIEDGAVLDVVGEPLLASDDAGYAATTTVELGRGARLLLSEIACVPASATIRLRTSIRRAGHELYYDALDAARTAPLAVGSFVIAGLDERRSLELLAVLDAVADAQAEVAVGVGQLAHGVFARLVAPDVWAVRTLLARLRSAARSLLFDALASGAAPERQARAPRALEAVVV